MPPSAPSSGASPAAASAPRPKRRRLPLLLGIVTLLLAGGGGAAWKFRNRFMPHAAPPPPPHTESAAKPVSDAPLFVELNEMTVTLPNGGHPRQLRIRIVLEMKRPSPQTRTTDLLTPRVYDALLTYLRTVQSDELAGGLALDRLRGNLYRRLSLLLGPDRLRDVLITSLVMV